MLLDYEIMVVKVKKYICVVLSLELDVFSVKGGKIWSDKCVLVIKCGKN